MNRAGAWEQHTLRIVGELVLRRLDRGYRLIAVIVDIVDGAPAPHFVPLGRAGQRREALCSLASRDATGGRRDGGREDGRLVRVVERIGRRHVACFARVEVGDAAPAAVERFRRCARLSGSGHCRGAAAQTWNAIWRGSRTGGGNRKFQTASDLVKNGSGSNRNDEIKKRQHRGPR